MSPETTGLIGLIVTVVIAIIIPSVTGVFKTHARLQQAESDIRSMQSRLEETERKLGVLGEMKERLVKIETLLDVLIKNSNHAQ